MFRQLVPCGGHYLGGRCIHGLACQRAKPGGADLYPAPDELALEQGLASRGAAYIANTNHQNRFEHEYQDANHIANRGGNCRFNPVQGQGANNPITTLLRASFLYMKVALRAWFFFTSPHKIGRASCREIV